MKKAKTEQKCKQYRSPALGAIHGTAEGLYSAGMMKRQTLREFDDACLTPVKESTPDEIRSLRLREGVSQAVSARYLNVTMNLVSQCERGEKHPNGASLKMLSRVARNGLQFLA
jgi:putative transcriptional regulator